MLLPHAFTLSSVRSRWQPLRALALMLFLAPVAQAQSFFWNVSDGLWPDTANWVDEVGDPVGALAANNGSGDYNLTNGTLGSEATTTMTDMPDPRFINSLTVGQYNTLFLTGNADTQNAGTPRIVAPLTNAGLIQAGSASTDFLRVEINASGTNLNTGEIRASQGTFRLQINSSTGNLDNSTTGLISVKSGAVLNMSNSPSGGSVLNGTLNSEAGGLIQVGIYDVQSKLRLDGVTVGNNGTFTTVQQYASTMSGGRTVNTYLNGATAFTNAVGATVNVLNTGTGFNAGSVTQLDVRFDINNTASFDNQGLLNITNDTTRTGGDLTSNAAVFSVTSATATFTNTGTIQVVNNSTGSSGATSIFTSVKSITNEGTVRVKGDVTNANASFTVTGSGASYTQSGTGLRTLLERGGALAAETIFINSGDLGGVGTVTGIDTYIGSGARMVAADTLADGAGAGVLTFNSHLTFDNNSSAVFALGADTASSGQVVLGAGFELGIGSNVMLTLADLDGSATSGTYRLFELDGGSVTGTFILNTLPAGWAGDLVYGADFVDFTFSGSPIPEPSTYALILGVVTLVAVAHRRRRV